MPVVPGSLADLAQRAGFEVTWTDAHGKSREVEPDTLRTLLDALGLPCAKPAQLRASIAALELEMHGPNLPPLITAEVDRAITLPVRRLKGGTRYKIELEQGGVIEGVLSVPKDAAALLAPIAEPGYHTLWLNEHRSCLAVAPRRCFSVGDAAGGDERARWWGVAAQIYGLRRPGAGGVGDYTALAELARVAAAQGAHALTISPVHAMFSANPANFSPYSPSSRLFLNVLHIDPAEAFGEARYRAAVESLDLDSELHRLETLELIDWPGVARARLAILRHLFDAAGHGVVDAAGESTLTDPLAHELAEFCQRGGQPLEDHARFEALHAALLAESSENSHWRNWPTQLQDPRNPAVDEFATANPHEIRFHLFAQWLAARGLAAAQRAARGAGMGLGLIADLAVGCDSAGSHSWSYRHDMLQGASVGAPPDIFNPGGQAWGLTTFSPRAMRSQGFGAFIDMLRASFANAGGIRIDHILGLRRLWLVPDGEPASAGRLSALSARRLVAADCAGVMATSGRRDRRRSWHRARRYPRAHGRERAAWHPGPVVRADRGRLHRARALGPASDGNDDHPRLAYGRGLVDGGGYRLASAGRPVGRCRRAQ